jgi:hypothetical protein
MFEATQKQQADMAQAIAKQSKLEEGRKREWAVRYFTSCGSLQPWGEGDAGKGNWHSPWENLTMEEAADIVRREGTSMVIEWTPPK